MDALHVVVDWPVDHVAAAVILPDGEVVTIGDHDRKYRLASLTKPMTAWAVLVGIEEGLLTLDDVPAGAQDGCTVRHLLSHSGGYPFEGRTPIAPPGRNRTYSNTGFEIAVEALVDAAGFSFHEYLREAIFEPLGMRSSSLEDSPAHGVWGTCADVVRFAVELVRPTLLHHDTVADVISPQLPDLAGIVPGVGRFDPCPWGLGVEIAGSKEPHWSGRVRSPESFGHVGGAGTMLLVDPIIDCAVVALTDRPFEEWAPEALRSWATLADAAFTEATERTGGSPG